MERKVPLITSCNNSVRSVQGVKKWLMKISDDGYARIHMVREYRSEGPHEDKIGKAMCTHVVRRLGRANNLHKLC